tara:strand:- start:63 stop:407 length:345 start_codon:yes stop_codon:yes gene_type:complete
MAQIPGNELFPEQKRSYGTPNVKAVPVTVGSGATSAYYFPGNARCVIVVATAAAKFQVVNEDDLLPRELYLAGQVARCTATIAGVLSGDVMPHKFAMVDTAGSGDNPMTIYFVY